NDCRPSGVLIYCGFQRQGVASMVDRSGSVAAGSANLKRLLQEIRPMRIRPFRFVAVLLCSLLLAACADPGPPPGGSVDELQRVDLKVGTGAVASSGDEVSVHYTGWLYDEDAPNQRGQQFDSSIERGEPITFLLGAGRVIRGWDEGVAGMHVGGRRVL